MSMTITEKTLSKMKMLCETTDLSFVQIADECGVAPSTISRHSISHGWQRPEGYIRPAGDNRGPSELILGFAHKLYDEGCSINEIAKRINRSPSTVSGYRTRYGWVRKRAEPKLVDEKDDAWPKVTAEWPDTERFDTPTRHYHDLDRNFLPMSGLSFWKAA